MKVWRAPSVVEVCTEKKKEKRKKRETPAAGAWKAYEGVKKNDSLQVRGRDARSYSYATNKQTNP